MIDQELRAKMFEARSWQDVMIENFGSRWVRDYNIGEVGKLAEKIQSLEAENKKLKELLELRAGQLQDREDEIVKLAEFESNMNRNADVAIDFGNKLKVAVEALKRVSSIHALGSNVYFIIGEALATIEGKHE
jgi:hypothetical protein